MRKASCRQQSGIFCRCSLKNEDCQAGGKMVLAELNKIRDRGPGAMNLLPGLCHERSFTIWPCQHKSERIKTAASFLRPEDTQSFNVLTGTMWMPSSVVYAGPVAVSIILKAGLWRFSATSLASRQLSRLLP